MHTKERDLLCLNDSSTSKKTCFLVEGRYQNLITLHLTGNPIETDLLSATTALYNQLLSITEVRKPFFHAASPKYRYFSDEAVDPGNKFLL